MKTTRMVAGLIAGLILAPAAVASPVRADTFLPFWTAFRGAALAGDMARLAGMTRFPLAAGFESDQDHAKAIDRRQFPAYFRTELRCGSSDGGSNIAMIRSKVRPDGKYDFHDASRATVGAFSFDKEAGGWKLTGLNYGDIGQYRARLKGRC